jgi:hypothetical protein
MFLDNDGVEEDDQTAPTGQEEEGVEEEGNDPADPNAPEGEEDEPEVDYAAELEAERAARTKAEQERDNYKIGLINAKKKLKGDKPKSDDEGEEEEEGEEEGLEDAVTKAVDKRLQALTQDTIDETLTELSSDPDEQKLIMFHYENTINKTGYSKRSIRADLENAQLLANRKKILKENREVKRALKTKQTLKKNAADGSNQDKGGESEETPKLSAQDMAFMKRHNLSPKDVKWNDN